MIKEACAKYKNLKIKVMKIKPCRYHKKLNQKYDLNQVVSKGICLDAFSIAYPYCLALLYDAVLNDKKLRKKYTLKCPGTKNYIVLQIKRVDYFPKPLLKIKKVMEDILANKMDLSPDVVTCKLILEVIDVKGTCPKGLKIGNKFGFNIYNTKKLCPAAFYAIFPFLRILNENKEKDSVLVSCPDANDIVYQISKEK